MSSTIHSAVTSAATDRQTSPAVKRAHAVAAALELIAARVSSGASVHLSEEMNRLSQYADQIQAALDK